jgi:hypothetical protein
MLILLQALSAWLPSQAWPAQQQDLRAFADDL